MLKLTLASKSAMQMACRRFHYSRSIPSAPFGYSVFEDETWCGVVIFGKGANRHIASQFNMHQGEVCELVRVALNGKQSKTSQVVSCALRLLKKDAPLVRLVISYADSAQGHLGILYQATNWYYIGTDAQIARILIRGKPTHMRTVNSRYPTASLEWVKKNVDPYAEFVPSPPKHRYLYPIDPSLRPFCESLKKPYPRADSVTLAQLPSGDQ